MARRARAPPSSSSFPAASAFPYEVDYNDHFETPLDAYEDILPLLDAVAVAPGGRGCAGGAAAAPSGEGRYTCYKDAERDRDGHVLYDPYYCDGRSAVLLNSLGFSNVIHERRDFYADLRDGTIPDHYHTMVTNPPYSADHKVRCLEYAVQALRGCGGGDCDGSKKKRRSNGKPFFILMPNYVASKEYYREVTADEDGNEARDIVYVVPSRPYEYDHPEGTGHDLPPFSSIWFCGIGEGNVERATKAFREYWNHHRTCTSSPEGRPRPSPPPRLATSLAQLREMGAIDSARRMNPRQRRKLKKRRRRRKREAESSSSLSVDRLFDATRSERSKAGDRSDDTGEQESGRRGKGSPGGEAGRIIPSATDEGRRRKKKKSKHRDANGVRKRRRF